MTHVLILEPDPTARAAIRRILDGAGYPVLEAATPREVADHLGAHDTPLVLVADPALPALARSPAVRRLVGISPTPAACVLVAPAGTLFRAPRTASGRPLGLVLLPRPFGADYLLAAVALAVARTGAAAADRVAR